MPLFVGRVGALSQAYQVSRLAYYDPSPLRPEIIYFDTTSLPALKLPYDPKSSNRTCTLWEYAIRSANTFVMPSLTGIKKKVGEALMMTVREDEEFWDILRNTGDKIIVFEDSHWFWGRYRPGLGQFWSGRNEMGELLMLVRDSYKNSLARLMPLEPFPLSSSPYAPNSGNSQMSPRPLSSSMFGRERPLTLDMARTSPSLSSRPIGTSSGSNNRSVGYLPPMFGIDELPEPMSSSERTLPGSSTRFPRSWAASPLPPLLSLEAPMYYGRSPAPSFSSTRSPPPPYASNPPSPALFFDFGPHNFDHPPPPPRVRTSGMYGPMSHPVPARETLPNRMRGINVNEDTELRELNRLREDFHARHRLESDPVADLRASAARRGAQQEAARASRHLREVQRAHIASEAAMSRRPILAPTAGRDSYAPQALRQADALGQTRRAEIEAKLVSHRRAMRDIHDRRRDRELDEIERLAGRSKRVAVGAGNENTPTRDRRYSMPLY